jgi:signal transduction histidine kinase
MTLTIVGWCTAALLGGLHLRARQRLVLVARASHELRGPLCAARLGLGTLASEPGRVAAIDLELARAGRALDDLAAAPAGARAREQREPIDLAELVRSYAPAWTALAAAHGAELRLEGAAARPRDARTPNGHPADAGLAAPGGHTAGAGLGAPGGHTADAGLGASGGHTARAGLGALGGHTAGAGLGAPGGHTAGAGLGALGGHTAGAGLGALGGHTADAGLTALADAVDAARRPRRHLRAVRADGTAATPRAAGDDLPRTWRADGPPAPAIPPPPTRVTADPLRIAQAVANLVSNAAEHGGGVIRVRVCGERERVRVEVADDGPGLPAPVGALVRAHTGRRGHGLAIAAGIAAHHGGRLSALPARAGARVVLDLPAAT